MRETDRALLSEVSPSAVAEYLQETGWTRLAASRSGRAFVWHKPGRGKRQVEVLLPITSDLTDYPVRIGELLDTLETIEGRPQAEIVRDLKESSAAAVILRANVTGRDSTIRAADGVALAEAALRIITAAAEPTIARMTGSNRRRSSLLAAFVQQLRFAPAESGSYTLRALVPADLKQPVDAKSTPASLGARVLTELSDILRRLDQYATQEVGDAFTMRESSLRVVASSLAGFGDSDEVHDLSVELSSRSPDPMSARQVFVFSSDQLSWLKTLELSGIALGSGAASRAPRLAPPDEIRLPGIEVSGMVRRLERPSVTLSATFEGRVRAILIQKLTEEEYQRAIEAHRERLPVICVGDLVRRGQRLVMDRPYVFDIKLD